MKPNPIKPKPKTCPRCTCLAWCNSVLAWFAIYGFGLTTGFIMSGGLATYVRYMRSY